MSNVEDNKVTDIGTFVPGRYLCFFTSKRKNESNKYEISNYCLIGIYEDEIGTLKSPNVKDIIDQKLIEKAKELDWLDDKYIETHDIHYIKLPSDTSSVDRPFLVLNRKMHEKYVIDTNANKKTSKKVKEELDSVWGEEE